MPLMQFIVLPVVNMEIASVRFIENYYSFPAFLPILLTIAMLVETIQCQREQVLNF